VAWSNDYTSTIPRHGCTCPTMDAKRAGRYDEEGLTR
jgi:hypothetical protein